MHTKLFSIRLGLFILLPTFGAVADEPNSNIKATQLPPNVALKLSDCSEITDHQAEWYFSKNLDLIDLDRNTKIYISTCERSASQIYSAIVLAKNGKTERLNFEQVINGKIGNERDTLAGAEWDQNRKTLTSIETAGCASEATKMIYKWNGAAFTLIEHANGFACHNPVKWKTIYSGE